jgi:peptidoglycan/xylan/chitin deacetylase (PgdA/CDA1 family)
MSHRHSCILTYHSLDSTASVVSVPPDVFQAQMEWLARSGMPVVSLADIRETAGAVAITFDDGFRNFFECAFPVLQRHGFPATVFVISEFCGRRNDWASQPRNNGIPIFDLMRWSEVEQVARSGITIGCHTATHPRMSRLSEAEIDQELRMSRAAIEEHTGRAVDTLAYPYGDSTPAIRSAAGRYFRLACGTRLAFVSPDADLLDLPRIDVYYFRNQFWFRGLGRRYGTGYLAIRGLLRGLRHGLIRDG